MVLHLCTNIKPYCRGDHRSSAKMHGYCIRAQTQNHTVGATIGRPRSCTDITSIRTKKGRAMPAPTEIFNIGANPWTSYNQCRGDHRSSAKMHGYYIYPNQKRTGINAAPHSLYFYGLHAACSLLLEVLQLRFCKQNTQNAKRIQKWF